VLPLLGPVMALMHNEHTVLDRQGTYRKVRVVGDNCCTCVKEVALQFSLALRLQYPGRNGNAVHKIHLADPATYYRLTSVHRGLDQEAARTARAYSPSQGRSRTHRLRSLACGLTKINSRTHMHFSRCLANSVSLACKRCD
jgi:putative heme degradation protein